MKTTCIVHTHLVIAKIPSSGRMILVELGKSHQKVSDMGNLAGTGVVFLVCQDTLLATLVTWRLLDDLGKWVQAVVV